MVMRSETTLDDVARVIGYTSTRVIQAWYAGQALYVPASVAADHWLARLLGIGVLRALVAEFPGQALKIPTLAADLAATRERTIAEQLAAGATVADIAGVVGLSERRVLQVRDELVLRGWLEYDDAGRATSGRRQWRAGAVPEILGTGGAAGSTGG